MSITPLDPADFNPTLEGFTKYESFRFWCQQVLPLTFDDSLSYYELLNKLVDYLNKTMENVNNLGTDVESLSAAYKQLEDYVNVYFSSLDVQTEIDNKLDEMASDGSLSVLLAPLIPNLVTDWLQENVTPTGSAVMVDSSLTISGAAADSKTVGDLLWYDRKNSNTYLRPFIAVNVTGLETFSIISDMPNDSFVFSAFSKFKNSLGDNFTWDVKDTTIFVIEKRRRGRTTGDVQYRVMSLGGITNFVGYSASSNLETITWYNVSYLGDNVNAIEEIIEKILNVNNNLCWFTDNTDRTINGLNLKFNEDGSISIEGTATNTTYLYFRGKSSVNDNNLDAGTYTFTRETIDGYGNLRIQYREENTNVNLISSNSLLKNTVVKTFENAVSVYATIGNGITLNGTFRIQIEEGSVESNYTPSIELYSKDNKARMLSLDNEKVIENYNNPPIRYCYTDFSDSEVGYWDSNGSLNNNANYRHTKKLKINPGDYLYTNYNSVNSWNGVVGAFFDKYGEMIKIVMAETDIEEQLLDSASASGGYSDRLQFIYKFLAPENAYYFSRNVALTSASLKYLMSISNFPIYSLSGEIGNLVIYNGNENYEFHKNEKIMFIGPSTVYLDKWNPNHLEEEVSGHIYPAFNEYIVGFQEYIVPWVSEVKSFGVSGGAWKSGYTPSIYDFFMNAQLNLGDYNTFVLLSSTNGTTNTDSYAYTDTDPLTYYGAMKGVCDYILNQNPLARIIIATGPSRRAYYTTPSRRERTDAIYQNGKQFAWLYGYDYIDLQNGCGFNEISCMDLTYDGTHYNQKGSRNIGLFLRKQIIGC